MNNEMLPSEGTFVLILSAGGLGALLASYITGASDGQLGIAFGIMATAAVINYKLKDD